MNALVIDASALCELLLGRSKAQEVARAVIDHDLYAPQLLVVEVVSVLRGWLRSGQISEFRAEEALADLRSLPITFVDADVLISGAWESRQNISAYDAFSVALARALQCRLLTCDEKLARAVPDVAWIP